MPCGFACPTSGLNLQTKLMPHSARCVHYQLTVVGGNLHGQPGQRFGRRPGKVGALAVIFRAMAGAMKLRSNVHGLAPNRYPPWLVESDGLYGAAQMSAGGRYGVQSVLFPDNEHAVLIEEGDTLRKLL